MPSVAARVVTATAWVLGTTFTTAILLGVGGLTAMRPQVAMVVAVVVLGLGLTLAEPAVIPLLAVPTLLVVRRVEAANVDLSISDLGLFVAFWPAVFLGRRPYSAPMRNLLWLSFLYQVSTLFTVVMNPYRANVVEWFHAWLLVSGALVVGWAIGRGGYAKVGLNLLVTLAALLAVIALGKAAVSYAHGDLSPVYPTWPYPMHKNFVGTVLGCVAVILYARPAFARWRRGPALTLFWLCVAGIVVSQSRQALIGLGVALIFIVLRQDRHTKRSKVIMLAIAPALALVGISVKEQLESGNEFNSAFQRLSWFQDSIAVWSHDPLFGAGLRWWYTDRFENRFQPPNAEIEVLTTAGLVGVLGFLALMVGTIVVLWRLDSAYGTVALAVLLGRLVQAQLDLFWVAAQTSLPFLVAGICLGAQALAHEDDDLRELTATTGERRVGAGTGVAA